MAVDQCTTKNCTRFSIMKTEIDFEAETDYSYTSNAHEEHDGMDETIHLPNSIKVLLRNNIPSRVNERAHINIIEMYEQASSEYRALFIYEDLFSRYVVLRPLKEEPGSANFVNEIAKKLIDIISLIGAPRILECSNGKSFAEKLVRELRNRIPALKMVHGNISKKKYSRRDWKALIQSWQMANPSRLWHEGLHIIQVHENTCNFSSNQGERSRNFPAEVFFKANLANDLVRSVSNTNSIEAVKSSIRSPLSLNEFIDSDDKKENLDSYNLINNMKNEVISVTEKNSIDEAGYESWTEEEWPIKIESCKSPVSPSTYSNESIDSNDIEQNVDKLVNSVNEGLSGTEKDSIDAKKCDVAKNDIFRCDICGRIFRRVCNLKNHMRSHKTTLRNKRKYASDTFSEEPLNITHGINLEEITNSHTKSQMMNVEKENNSGVENEINPRRHSSRISISSNKKTIKLRKFKYSQKRPYQRDINKKSYPSTYTLRRHMSAAHQRNKIYKCETCAKTFNSRSVLTKHMLVHNDVRPFEFDMCKRTLKLCLQRYIADVHEDIRQFKCDVCKATFISKQNLQYHITSVHEGIKQFKCYVCKAKFTSKQNLQYHIASVHEGIKQFKCYICKATFTSKQNLQYHIASIHEGISQFKCYICKATFTSKQNLRYHITSVHEGIRQFKCYICKATFTSKQNLQYHIASVHEGISQFKCGICNATFTAKQSLQRHIGSIHEGIRPFKCDICKNTFTSKQNLRLHALRVHI